MVSKTEDGNGKEAGGSSPLLAFWVPEETRSPWPRACDFAPLVAVGFRREFLLRLVAYALPLDLRKMGQVWAEKYEGHEVMGRNPIRGSVFCSVHDPRGGGEEEDTALLPGKMEYPLQASMLRCLFFFFTKPFLCSFSTRHGPHGRVAILYTVANMQMKQRAIFNSLKKEQYSYDQTL